MKRHSLLITGSNRGLGVEFAKQYAAKGWRVYATCRDPKKASHLQQLAKQYAHLSLHALDVTNGQQIRALADELSDQSIDILLNNAGVFGPSNVALADMTVDAWQAVIRVNAMAPLFLAQAFVAQIAKSEKKVIAAVSSRMGSITENTLGGRYMYRSSKAALNMVFKTLAIDLASQQISCVVFNPGWVRTDMGGAEATFSPEESVSRLIKQLDQITPAQSGQFINYDGVEIPW